MEEQQQPYSIHSFEGVNRRVSVFLRKKGELYDALNAVFSKIIGAVAKREGNEKRGDDLTSTTSTTTSTSTTTTSTSTSSSTTTSTTSSTSTSSTSTSTTSTSSSTTE